MKDLFGVEIPEKPEPKKRGEVVSEIAPGQLVSHVEVWELPTYVLSKLVPSGDGQTYRLEMVDEWAGWVPITEIRKRLGLRGMSTMTLHRLCAAGFLEHCQPTPQTFLVKIDSLIEHLERTRDQKVLEDSWWTSQRRQLWSQTCGV